MRRRSDLSHEMPGEFPPDDALAPFAEEVRFAVSGPPPVPSITLAEVMTVGFSGISPTDLASTDKGDLLVTAASNVHGPAPQVAGLPNWKEETDMPVNGIFATLLAKLAGASTVAKGALAGVTAVTTMAMAGGAAGVLPGPAQTLVASAVNAATPFEFPGAGDVTGTVEHAVGNLPDLPVPVTLPALPATPSASASAGAQAGTKSGSATPTASGSASGSASTPAITPTVPGLPSVPNLPQVSIPPAVAGLVNGLPACVKNLIPAGGGTPDPTKLAAQIPSCITQVLSTSSLPPQVAKCVASVLGTIGGASGMSTAAVPSIGSLNVSSCVPMDSSKCVSSMLGLLATMPNLSGGGLPNLTGGGLPSLPTLTNLAGCVPMNVPACITSISASAGTGTAPKLDLSTCMPLALPTTGLPGAGTLPGLSTLSGFTGALPFLGK
jgi:hypothetical protein